MMRIVVLGGYGFFGAVAMEQLRTAGLRPLAGSRRAGAGVRVDVEDAGSLRGALRAGDVVVDTVGPFQDRTTRLVEAAIEVGFDVVDISDSVAYGEAIQALRPAIDARGIRVLTSCSSVSAISAAVISMSGLAGPRRLTAFLVPAARYAAYPATAESLLRSLGRPVRVWRGGRMEERPGWRDSFVMDLPAPTGRRRGRLFESADSVTLPKVWPSLETAEMYVAITVPGLGAALALAARSRAVRGLVRLCRAPGMALARRLGTASGCFACEVEGRGGEVRRFVVFAASGGYAVPIVPAVIAARRIAQGSFAGRGLVPADGHVAPDELLAELRATGAECTWTGC
jgi:hypothetical protein